MTFGINVYFVVVATGEFILGMLGNGFIGLVNCIKWVKTGKVSMADFILTGLAMARIIQLWVILLDSFITGLFPHLYATGKLAKVITILWILCNHITIWFATCLSVFYFLKIANFSHFLFVWLKWRVNRVVLVLFLGSFFVLLLNLLTEDSLIELWMNSYRVQEGNMTLHLNVNEMLCFKSFLLSLTYVIPFLLSLISLLLLFLSLVRHTKNLQLNRTASKDSSTEAHRRAMKMVTIFLLLLVIYIISTLIATWIFAKGQSYHYMMLVVIVATTIFPSGHSFIIILGSNRLRQIAVRLLQHLKFSVKCKVFGFIDII